MPSFLWSRINNLDNDEVRIDKDYSESMSIIVRRNSSRSNVDY